MTSHLVLSLYYRSYVHQIRNGSAKEWEVDIVGEECEVKMVGEECEVVWSAKSARLGETLVVVPSVTRSVQW